SALDANADPEDNVISVADASAFSAGGYAVIGDSQFGGKVPFRILQIKEVDTDADTITFFEPIGITLLTSASASATVWNPVGPYGTRNSNSGCADGTGIVCLFWIVRGNGFLLENCTIRNHVYTTTPANQTTIYCGISRGVRIRDNTFLANDPDAGGDAIMT